MLSDILFTMPDGRDTIVRLDTTLDKNEIRVGSLGALDHFMSDASKFKSVTPPSPRYGKRGRVIRLSRQVVLNAREWLDKNLPNLSKEERAVMLYFFPPKEKGMASSKGLEGGESSQLGMGAEKAREIRNRLLQHAGILP